MSTIVTADEAVIYCGPDLEQEKRDLATRCRNIKVNLQGSQDKVHEARRTLNGYATRIKGNTALSEILIELQKQTELTDPLYATCAGTINRLANDTYETRHAENTVKERIERIYRDIETYEVKLNTINAKLAKVTPPPRTTTLGAVKNNLEKMPHIVKDSVYLENTSKFGHTREQSTICWCFSGLQMTPNKVPSWVNEGEPFPIALPNIKVTLLLNTGKLYFTLPADASNTDTVLTRRYYAASRTVHPHVINSDGGACLGDFGGVITELWNSGDIVGVAELAQMFLQQINTNDTAGKHWVKRLYMAADDISYNTAPEKRGLIDGKPVQMRLHIEYINNIIHYEWRPIGEVLLNPPNVVPPVPSPF